MNGHDGRVGLTPRGLKVRAAARFLVLLVAIGLVWALITLVAPR